MNDIRDTLSALAESGNLREIPQNLDSGVIDFTSNDYLGLATNRNLRDNFLAALDADSFRPTSSASRLLCGYQHEYSDLEQLIADAYSRPTLLFNSGYHANTGMIAALGGKNTLFVADKLVHASVIDGLKLSGSTFMRFRHNDLGHLERLVSEHAPKFSRTVIVAESVYSMDGDSPDIGALIDIKRRITNALLYIDEAHAVGVVGNAGLGLSQAYGADVDIIVGTMGKALAAEGAFAVLNDVLRQFMVNRCRSLIFSTAISPLAARWAATTFAAALSMDSQREHLQKLARKMSAAIGTACASHIQPVIVGDAHRTLQMSKALRREGLAVLPIRTPTVPPGTERLRISLSAAHSEADISKLTSSLLNF